MTNQIRIVSYVNQFFGGLGGEDAAGISPSVVEGSVGPGKLVEQLVGDRGYVAATVIGGDNYMAEEPAAIEEVVRIILDHHPDLVIVGPAFQAGRYGVACAEICTSLYDAGVPAVTGFHPENPGVDVNRSKVYSVETGASAASMQKAMEPMVRIGLRLAEGVELSTAAEEGYMPRGIRRNIFASSNAAERAVDLLMRKIRGEPYETEIPLPVYNRVSPSHPEGVIGDLTIAIITEAGVVPTGNPDNLESARSQRWLTYPIGDLEELSSNQYQTIHGGFDNAPVNADPNRAVPIDVLRELEREGAFGRLYEEYYVTTGMTMVLTEAERIGREIAADLLRNQIQAAVLTST